QGGGADDVAAAHDVDEAAAALRVDGDAQDAVDDQVRRVRRVALAVEELAGAEAQLGQHGDAAGLGRLGGRGRGAGAAVGAGPGRARGPGGDHAGSLPTRLERSTGTSASTSSLAASTCPQVFHRSTPTTRSPSR